MLFLLKKRTVCTVDNATNLFNVLRSFKRHCLLVSGTALGTGDEVMKKHK